MNSCQKKISILCNADRWTTQTLFRLQHILCINIKWETIFHLLTLALICHNTQKHHKYKLALICHNTQKHRKYKLALICHNTQKHRKYQTCHSIQQQYRTAAPSATPSSANNLPKPVSSSSPPTRRRTRRFRHIFNKMERRPHPSMSPTMCTTSPKVARRSGQVWLLPCSMTYSHILYPRKSVFSSIIQHFFLINLIRLTNALKIFRCFPGVVITIQ